MADKNRNEILEEQRRAREEFLRLKRMQQGELDAGPKPSEVAIMPKTPKEKLANFWFQYKIHTIAIVFTVIILIVLVAQCASREEYDMGVVYFTYTPALDSQTEKIADYFNEYSKDISGDGEVNVKVVNCSVSGNNSNVQYNNTMLTKIQAILAADETTLLFITDEKSMAYFDNISTEGDIFTDEPFLLGEDFYEKTKTDDFGKLPEGLGLSCRKISNTLLEDKGNVKEYYEESLRVLEKIKKQLPKE